MNIEPKSITVKELSNGYVDNLERGVLGFGGRLDIRPPYQREFIYNDEQRDAVIRSVNNGYPLNVMYWAVRDDGSFEIIDGQQRTIALCQYVCGDFSYEGRYFDNLQSDEKRKILDYKLSIYQCAGTDSERLDWFKIINIAGEKLTDQELRNAVYSGPWVTHAKIYFSKINGPAHGIAADYIRGSAKRQEYLETAIKWISKDNIDEYMGANQSKENADLLWNHFQSVINWVKTTFYKKRSYMKSVDWGTLYDKYGNQQLDSKAFEAEISELILDDDVTSKSGIYPYILTRDARYLQIRAFSEAVKLKVFERQGGKCRICNKKFDISDMEGDHIKPWIEGGKTMEDNCQILCKNCNRRKSAK